jgi:hypothetical protein
MLKKELTFRISESNLRKTLAACNRAHLRPECTSHGDGERCGVLGWTSANVMKRLQLTDKQQLEVLQLGTHEWPVLRWRVAHVLGAFPNERNVDFLLDRLDHDSDISVKYGALRSAIELASRSENIAQRVVPELIKRTSVILQSPRLTTELSRAVFLSPEFRTSGWAEQMSSIFYNLMEHSEDMTQLERWSKIASELRLGEYDLAKV